MTQETVEAVRGVRIPLVPETRRHRTLEERILVRFPGRQGFAALNRRDFDLLVIGLDPSVELRMGHVLPDIGPVFHGHDGYREVWRHLLEAADTRLHPEELLDLRDRVLVTAKLTAQGAALQAAGLAG